MHSIVHNYVQFCAQWHGDDADDDDDGADADRDCDADDGGYVDDGGDADGGGEESIARSKIALALYSARAKMNVNYNGCDDDT